ncbi:MAG: type II toxin-antitoxin system RelE/ParE family toxin [Pelagimonas sp.]|jgi:toxin ParE1/3/4|nr:type II toxin-antitoxin system RelE/ParE family toxin [Pelagimonas sp.]
MTFRLSAKAEADLIDIYVTSVQKFGVAQAERYQDKIEHTLMLIGTTPELARLRREITPPVRIHPIGSHLIVYTTDDGGTRILRVRHQRENWTRDPVE